MCWHVGVPDSMHMILDLLLTVSLRPKECALIPLNTQIKDVLSDSPPQKIIFLFRNTEE